MSTTCDRCGAGVMVTVRKLAPTLSSGPHSPRELAFCAHHFAQYEAQLTRQGFLVVNDNRRSLANA